MNKNGAALIGLLLTCVILAALIYGSSFFWNDEGGTDPANLNSANVIKTLHQAQDDIKDINGNTEEYSKTADGAAAETDATSTEEATE